MRVRRDVEDALDQAGAAPRDLQQLPPVLHGPPEADRHRRPRRALHQALRRADVREPEGRPRKGKKQPAAPRSAGRVGDQPGPPYPRPPRRSTTLSSTKELGVFFLASFRSSRASRWRSRRRAASLPLPPARTAPARAPMRGRARDARGGWRAPRPRTAGGAERVGRARAIARSVSSTSAPARRGLLEARSRRQRSPSRYRAPRPATRRTPTPRAPIAGLARSKCPARSRPGRAPAPRAVAAPSAPLPRQPQRAAVTAASDTRSSRLCSSTGSSGRGSPVRRNWKNRPGSRTRHVADPAHVEQHPLERRQPAAAVVVARAPPQPPRRVQHVEVRHAVERHRHAMEQPARLHHRHVEGLAVVGDDQIRVVEELRRRRRAARARPRSW